MSRSLDGGKETEFQSVVEFFLFNEIAWLFTKLVSVQFQFKIINKDFVYWGGKVHLEEKMLWWVLVMGKLWVQLCFWIKYLWVTSSKL